MLCFHFREQPVTHTEQHHSSNQHGNAFEDFASGGGVGQQPLEKECGDDARAQRPPDGVVNDFLLIAMPAFVDVGDDRGDDEQRF